MSKLAKALTAAAGNAGESLYVEDVFSTYLYEGDGQSNRDIVNGVNLADNGGLVWLKTRSTTYNHFLANPSEFTGYAQLPLTSAWTTSSNIVTFNTDGFRIPIAYSGVNAANSTSSMSSWTFRKAEKFFDVVTWTGDGTGARTISHSLNGTVGALFMKATNAAMQWFSYHNGLTNAQFLELNATTSAVSSTNAWNNTTPTSSEFTVGSYGNISGRTYVAYLFASDAGGFGDDGSESIIKCGSYTGTGTAGLEVSLGFEPQWLLIKRSDSTSEWALMDNMRGIVSGGTDVVLRANTTNADITAYDYAELTPTGFSLTSDIDVNTSGGTYIYIAIRRPMKTPESGTEVFAIDTGNSSGIPEMVSGFPVDAAIIENIGTNSYAPRMGGRLTGTEYLLTFSSAAGASDGSQTFDFMDGFFKSTLSSAYIAYMFKRATGFFDVVAYTGDGTSSRNINHNLGAVPELMIRKTRNNADSWQVYSAALTNEYSIILNTSAAAVGPGYSAYYPTEPTDTVFTVGNAWNTNSYNMIVYLFATLAGVSKVGSYTGTGSNVDVDCGFSAGARFILIKRTDSTGDWYVWDSERGIVAGNDPYLLLNSTAAEVTSTDYIDPLSSGFTVTSSAPAALNASGGTYIFLAIA